jgi:predicted metalloprotease
MPDQDEFRWPTADPDRRSAAPPGVSWSPPVHWNQPGRAAVPGAPRHQDNGGRRWSGGVALVVLLAMLAAVAAVQAGTRPRAIEGLALPATAATADGPATLAVPPVVTPATPRPRAVYLLADHPLLAAGVALSATTCTLPPFRRDTASLNAYYLAFVACMDATWQPVLAARGMPFQPPKVNVAVHPGQTECGDLDADEEVGEFTALYCPADETLYLPVDRLKRVDHGQASSHLAVVAHEYSHHVQELSGLLGAAAEATGKAGENTPAGNEVTRRTELEANCFAGLFLAAAAGRGSISKTLAEQSVGEFRNGALPQTHGSPAHQAFWAKQGYLERTTAVCNTWSASTNSVS